MVTRTVAAVAALCALAAPASAAHAEDVIRPSRVAAGVTLDPAASSGVMFGCKRPAVALNGAASGSGAGELVRSGPRSELRDWDFEFDAAHEQSARAEIRCIGLRLPRDLRRAVLKVNTVRSGPASLAAGTYRTLRPRCDRGYVPTGYGLEHEGNLSIGTAVPGAGGWRLRVENRGAAKGRATLRIRCLKRTVTAFRDGEPVTLRFAIRHAAFSDSVSDGSSVSHSCRTREFSLATGVEIERGPVAPASSRPSGPRGGRWSFTGAAGTVKAKTYLLCLGLGSRFR
ncbi:MAG TPA: hypothetical protein VHJ37_04715 [Thermoleophilaceae bacterium]|jgi:hypothetical protein|nr:hypothetical protein [Thermoleophilaceae bacterium]